jgi:hypothetical protein
MPTPDYGRTSSASWPTPSDRQERSPRLPLHHGTRPEGLLLARNPRGPAGELLRSAARRKRQSSAPAPVWRPRSTDPRIRSAASMPAARVSRPRWTTRVRRRLARWSVSAAANRGNLTCRDLGSARRCDPEAAACSSRPTSSCCSSPCSAVRRLPRRRFGSRAALRSSGIARSRRVLGSRALPARRRTATGSRPVRVRSRRPTTSAGPVRVPDRPARGSRGRRTARPDLRLFPLERHEGPVARSPWLVRGDGGRIEGRCPRRAGRDRASVRSKGRSRPRSRAR